MTEGPDQRNPMVVASEWVARITTVALEMSLPAVVGHWLDRRFGTQFLVLIGLALGLVGGIWHLLAMTRVIGSQNQRNGDSET